MPPPITLTTRSFVVTRKRAAHMLLAAGLASTLCLAGCAPITSVPPGTPIGDVVNKYGKPAVSCDQQDGSKRLVWTSQPAGESAWATELTADKRISGFQQVLDNQHFGVVSAGSWTAEMVRCEFGPPASVETFSRGRDKGTIWSYHYQTPSGLFKLLNIHFGPDGKTVSRVDTNIDPARDPSMFGFSN